MTSVWVILAVAYLDLKEIIGKPLTVFSLLFSTCMSLVLIAVVLSESGTGFAARLTYLFPGVLGVQCLACLSTVSGRIQADRSSGTFLLMMLSPSKTQALVIGHIVAVVARVLLQALILIVLVSLILEDVVLGRGQAFVVVAWALIMGAIIFGSLGVVLTSLFAGLSQILLMVIMSIGTIASTAYFTFERVPVVLRPIARVNPVSFLCDSLRCGLQPDNAAIDWYPFAILTGQALVALAMTMMSSRMLDRQAAGA